MIALTTLWKNLFKIFYVYADTGGVLEVSSRGKVYEITISPTGRKVPLNRYKPREKKSFVNLIESGTCPRCQDMTLNGVCANRRCNPKSGINTQVEEKTVSVAQ